MGEGLSQTREHLADTVVALAHKVDVRSGVTDKWHATKDTVQDKLGQVTRHLQEGKEAVQAKAEEVTRQAKSLPNQVPAQIAAPVAGRVNHLTQALRQRPAPVAAMVFTVLVLLLFRRLFRKAE
jgi:gas vesicle protein